MSNIISLWPAYVNKAIAEGGPCWFNTEALQRYLSAADTLSLCHHHDDVLSTQQDVQDQAIKLASKHLLRCQPLQKGIRIHFNDTGYVLTAHLNDAEAHHALLMAIAAEGQVNTLVHAQQNPLPSHRHPFFGALQTKELEGLVRCAAVVEKLAWSEGRVTRSALSGGSLIHLATRDPYTVKVDAILNQLHLQWRYRPEMLVALTLPAFVGATQLHEVAELLRLENKTNRYWIAEHIAQAKPKSIKLVTPQP